MTSKKNLGTLKRFQSEVNRAIKWRLNEDLDTLWRRMINMYAGKQYDTDSIEDRMVINSSFRIKNVIAPSVAVNNPKFLVQARRAEQGPHALITEEVLNYMWRAHRYQSEFRLAVDDALVVGFGWTKCGYKFKTEVKKADPNTDGSTDFADGGEPGVDDREKVDGNVESEVKIHDDRPFVERISPFDIYVDPDARNLNEARWIAQRIKRPVSDVKVDKRYIPAHRVNCEQQERDAWSPADEDERESLTGNESSNGFVDVWEYYDLRTEEVATFVMNYEGGFLVEPKPQPYPFGHPFEMIRNYNVPDRFYPMGELEAIEVLQKELNKTRTEQMLHRRQNQRKYIADERLDPEAIDALKSDKDNEVVRVNGAIVDINKAVVRMPSHAINADAYNMSDVISQDIDETTGVQDFGQSQIRRTATEAALIQDQQNARSSDKLSNIEGSLARIGEKLIQLLQSYMTGEQVVRIVGSDAMPLWLTYDKDYIQGQFDYQVEAGSTQPRNESFRAQRAMQLMEAMAPFLQMGVADPMAVMRRVLQDGFGVKDPSQFFAQQKMPQDPNGGGGPGGPGGPPGSGGPPPGMPPSGPPPGMPPMPQGGPPEMGGDQSPIEGIPPELLARLNVGPSPVMQR